MSDQPKTQISKRKTSPAFWLLLATFALEFILFDQFGARRHTSVYPRWNDQIQYLSESYLAYEHMRASNFGSALEAALINPSAQGTLHDAAALIAFKFAGPSRSAALALNLLALIAWQTALYVAVSRLGVSRTLAFAAAMLPLALAGPWENVPGSAYDFRLDHFAMCAIGTTAALALGTNGLRDRRACYVFGLAVGVTLLTRFLTGTYFVLIFAGLLGWALSREDRRARGLNLLRAALVALLVAGPFFWLNRQYLFEYYWIGHYIGPESSIRDPHLGLTSSLRFVFGGLAQRHLGPFFGALAAVATILFAIPALRRTGRSEIRTPHSIDRRPALLCAIIGLIFLCAPAVVLTLHKQKSDVVLGALVPGVILLVVAAWLAFARRTSVFSAALVASSILVFFGQRQLRPAYDAATLAHIRQVNQIADFIFARVTGAKLPNPRVGVDYITDCLDAQVLRVVCYERKKVWLPLDMTLPTGIAEPTEADVMERLARSDFFFLTENDAPGNFPYDRKLAAMRPRLRTWCEENLQLAHRFDLLGRRMALYQRREIPLNTDRH